MWSFILQNFLPQLLTYIPPFSSSNLQLCSAAFCAHVMGEGRKQEPPCWFSMRQDKDRYPRTGGGCRWTSRPSGSRCWAPSPCSYTGCRSWRHWMISLVKKLSVAFNSDRQLINFLLKIWLKNPLCTFLRTEELKSNGNESTRCCMTSQIFHVANNGTDFSLTVLL